MISEHFPVVSRAAERSKATLLGTSLMPIDPFMENIKTGPDRAREMEEEPQQHLIKSPNSEIRRWEY